MSRFFFTLISLILISCVDVHDNPINVTAKIDMCELLETIESEDVDEKEDSSLIPNWEYCEYNEECQSQLCACNLCIDTKALF